MAQQPSAQGIASLFRGNPAPLQQRIQKEQQGKPGLPPDLHELMALNIVTNETDAMAKQKAMDQLAQMQGPQGKPPTVMDSVREQARQKMQAQAMQAQQQQQGLQALMQQAPPGPVPEGTQFAEAQPQGIDELPVEFGLAGGGIVAFQKGGDEGEKYETPYDRMNRKNRGELTEEERREQEARDALISQIPTGGEPTVTGGERVRGSEIERNILNTLAAMPGASVTKATTLGRQALAGLAGLLGNDKANAPEAEKPAPQAAAPKMQEQTYRRVSGDSGVRPPVSDLKALAEQKRRQQAPTPVAAAPVPAPVAATPQETPVQDSDAIKKLKAVMGRDPMVEREAEQARRLKEIGAVDTSTHDRMIAELEKRKAQLEGPQDSYGRLMEYLGQIAATPRGMSSFEAGAAGAANLRSAEKARQLEQFNLSKQALEVSQKKIDTVRAFATEQYNVGKTRFDQVYKEEFEAAKALVTDEREAEKLAQENTLKRLEIASAERRNAATNATQLQTARISAAAREAAGGGESKEIAAAEAAFARDPEAAALKKQLENPIFANNPAKSAVLIKRLRDIQASKYAQFGIKMEPAPGAASPGGTSLKYNPATGKIE
jgi:hypothetical protein